MWRQGQLKANFRLDSQLVAPAEFGLLGFNPSKHHMPNMNEYPDTIVLTVTLVIRALF